MPTNGFGSKYSRAVPAKKPVGSKKDRLQDRKIAKLEKIIGKRELKFEDIGYTANPTWALGTIAQLLAPAQNVTESGRIGDSINIEKVDIRLNLRTLVAGAVTVRVLLVRAQSNNLSEAEIYQQAYVGTLGYVHSSFNPDWRSTFQVLMDKTFQVDANANPHRFLAKTIKVNKKMTLQNATTNEATGALYWSVVSDQAVATTRMDLYTRTYYSDL